MPITKILCKARKYWTGHSMNAVDLINALQRADHEIHLASMRGYPSRTFRRHAGAVRILHRFDTECDNLVCMPGHLMMHAHIGKYWDWFNTIGQSSAARKLLCFYHGKTIPRMHPAIYDHNLWTYYIFANTRIKKGFAHRYQTYTGETVPEEKMAVLHDPVFLEPFLALQPDYAMSPELVTVISSVKKYPRQVESMLQDIHAGRRRMKIHMMERPNIPDQHYLDLCYKFDVPVPEFLMRGTVFWYAPRGPYHEAGPRCIMEAMAAGLPVISQNRDGMADKVDKASGWLQNKWADMLRVIANLRKDRVKKKGIAAKERAAEEFKLSKWVDMIEGEKYHTEEGKGYET